MESLAHWNAHFLSFSFAAQTACSRVGSVINDLSLPQIYVQTRNLSLGFWVGACLAFLGLFSIIAFIMLERYADRREIRSGQVMLSSVFYFPRIYWLLAVYVGLFYMVMDSFNEISSALAQYRFGFSVSSAGVLIV